MQRLRDRLQSRPEQSVVHEQKIDAFLYGFAEDARGDIYRRTDSCDAAGVFDLQSIERVWPVLDLANAQIFVGIFNYFGERRHLPKFASRCENLHERFSNRAASFWLAFVLARD